MLNWKITHPNATLEHLGFIPDMVSDHNPLPAKEQFDANYQHGGGWHSFPGFEMTASGLKYPGDPEMPMLAEAVLHAGTDKEEIIRFYDCSWVAIVQKDGSFDIARMD